jgi:lipopolysaccharide transport system ATP-binding protein
MDVIKVNNISKKYILGESVSLTVAFKSVFKFIKNIFKKKEANQQSHAYANDFWALKNVSFEVRKGEILGIIGTNGSGKSTLLKILSRVTVPTEGSATIHGRVSSLLEVGTGFNPELTGRENIYLNGALLGLSQEEVESKISKIIEFSGVEKFIDTPLKRYSSGMNVRLGFSVAAHLDSEIMIVDEVLAVGDADFQRKSFSRLNAIRNSGKSILFVSHSMELVANLCQRVLWLHQGEVKAIGAPKEVINQYLHYYEQFRANQERKISSEGSGKAFISEMYLCNEDLHKVEAVSTGEKATFKGVIKGLEIGKSSEIGLNFWFENQSGTIVTEFNSVWLNKKMQANDSVEFVFQVDKMSLVSGMYSVHHELKINHIRSDYVLHNFTFVVLAQDYFKSGLVPTTSGQVFLNFDINLIGEERK